MLVRFQDVSKSFGAFDVLREISFQIQPGQKVGLIGANGAGKTTLLSLITGPEEPDSGRVTRASDLRAGKLDQVPDFHERTSVLDSALESFVRLRAVESQLGEMETSIADRPDPDLLERYSQLQHEFEFQGGYSYRARTEAALQGVGFRREQFVQPANSLSGGEKNRLALARLLLSDVDLFLLDEPTNHLDIRSIEWLEHYLRETDRALLMVSHDRFFLDRIVSRILDLRQGRIDEYAGNYSAYLRQHAERMELQRKEWRRQQEWIARTEDYIRRNIAGQKTRQAQSRRNALARIQRIERPMGASDQVKFRFQSPARIGRYVITARGLSVGYPDRTILEELDVDVERGERWALVGPNGSGKTTLLKSLVGGVPPLAGELSWDERLEIGYYDQQMEDLNGSESVVGELRAMDSEPTDGELRSFLAQFLFQGDEVFKRISDLSGGEKSRLSLAKIIYAGPTLLALDEPTNHLDIASREALEIALDQYPGTMLFVTHDRYLVQKIASHIIYLDGERAESFDRFDAFEAWLASSIASKPEKKEPPANQQPGKEVPGLSKNRRERLMREIHELEGQIAAAEGKITEIEGLFQKPSPETDWDKTNRRYADLKQEVEQLYEELNNRLAIIG